MQLSYSQAYLFVEERDRQFWIGILDSLSPRSTGTVPGTGTYYRRISVGPTVWQAIGFS